MPSFRWWRVRPRALGRPRVLRLDHYLKGDSQEVRIALGKTKPILLVALAFLPFVLLGCVSNINAPRGWAGVTIGGDTLYVAASDGKVVAVDAMSGGIQWVFAPQDAERLSAIYSAPVFAKGVPYGEGPKDLLYVAGYSKKSKKSRDFKGTVYALNASPAPEDEDGEVTWQMSVDGEIVAEPVVAGDVVLIGSSDGHLYALRSGEIEEGEDRLKWKFPQEGKVGKIWASPAVSEGVVYIGSMDHTLYALSLETGEELWRFSSAGAITARPLVLGDRIYVGSLDRKFYVLDAKNKGDEVWSFSAKNWFWAGAASDGNKVYAVSMDGLVYEIDPERDDSQRVLFDGGGAIMASPVLVPGGIAVATRGGSFQVVNMKGEVLWPYEFQLSTRSQLTSQGEIVYIPFTNGSVRAVDARRGTVNCERCWTVDSAKIKAFTSKTGQ